MAGPLRIGVGGARGRMGQAVAKAVATRSDAVIAAAYDQFKYHGQSVGDLTLTFSNSAIPLCDVIIEFTSGEASGRLAKMLTGQAGPALVIGSTGWSQADEARLERTAKTLPVVRSGNFSLGINVLAGLVQQAARRLPALDWDIEVFEAHHRRKVDAPSGTALMLGEAAARGRDIDLSAVQVRARDGITGPRPDGAIGFSVMRGGGIVGEHSVVFAGEEEVLTFSHSARDRALFARGAIVAALWVVGKPPGLYDMMDVLGFRD